METSTLSSHVADRGTLATQEDIVTSAGVMPGGRCVRQQEAAVPVSGQMAVAPDTSRPTILSHTATTRNTSGATMGMASMGTASAREEEAPETTEQAENFLLKSFQSATSDAVNALSEAEIQYKNGKITALSLCLTIAKKMEILSHRKEIDTPAYEQHIRTKAGPLYADHLNQALYTLQNYVMTERSWEYYGELSTLARCFRFYPEYRDSSKDKKMLADVYQQFVNNELTYLDNTRNSVFQYSRKHSFHIINTLLADDSPARSLKILESDLITELKTRAAKLMNNREDLSQQIQNGSNDEMAQKIGELQQQIRTGTSDMTGKRQYHGMVMERIEAIEQEWKRETVNISDHQLVQLIIKLAECCDKCKSFLNEFEKLKNNLRTLASCITGYTLMIIKDRGKNVDQLKEKTMKIIQCLLLQGWLNSECRNLYFRCSQPQPTVQTDQITDLQFHWRLSTIMSLLNREAHADHQESYLKAADMLVQLLNSHANEMDTLCTENTLRALIKSVNGKLYAELFENLMIEWSRLLAQRLHHQDLDNIMSTYCPTFIKLNPYTHVVLYEQARLLWQKMACFAWNPNLKSLSEKHGVLDESDADSLLSLKAIAPKVSENCTRHCLEYTLMKFFQRAPGSDRTTIPARKVAELSEWTDFLVERYGRIDGASHRSCIPALIKYNKQWKARHGCKTTSAPGEVTPTLTHPDPGTVTFMKVPVCPPCTEQQFMPCPAMQPPAAPYGMPAPADSWSCQQPATVTHASPANQAPMAAGPYPTPIQQFQPAPYGMPTPADSWSCQQPATVTHASPANQAPMAAGPYPTPIQQFQPAPYGMPAPADSWSCQQPATVTHASPANQAPIAAGPYPTPIQQFQPAPYGMPAPADSWSCQQPATVIHASPATQAPMAAGPYPTPIQQFQPAPYGMPAPADSWSCQQPATVIHASPATQAPMAAGPYPTPIQQFQPAPYGTLTGSQLPMPAMMSHFPAHPHVQVCPSCQFTACEPVQSQEQMATQQQYSVQPATSEHGPKYSGNF